MRSYIGSNVEKAYITLDHFTWM